MGTESAPRNRTALWRNVGLAAAFAVPFVVYLITLAPTLNFEDPMEFALGCATLGVDHPSGYPLQTLFGHLFTYLPSGEVAWRVNLASATFGALASAFIFLLTWELLAPAVADRRLLAAGSWAAGGLFAFSATFWPQAVITEVYALNAAVLAATLWCGARCNARRDPRWFYATAFAASLAAANHPLSLTATAPLLIYLWFKLKREAGGAALAANGAALMLLGVSIYLYLALRASREPPLNWGTPADLPRFLDHVRRREFGTIFWPRYRYLPYHTWELGRLLLFQFGPGLGALAVVGLAWLLKSRTPYVGVLAVLAAIVGPATMLPLVGLLTPHQIYEIEVWYLSFFLVCAPLAAAALLLLIVKINRRRVTAAAAALLALLPTYPCLANWSKADLHGFRFPFENGCNRLRTFEYRGIVGFPFYGRQGLFSQSYLGYVEGYRPDVTAVDPRNYVRGEFAATARGPRFIVDPDAAEMWWFGFKRDLLSANYDRPFYYNVREGNSPAWGAELVPYGLLYRARRPGWKEAVPGPPWDRYDYRGLRAVGKSIDKKSSAYGPTTYRTWTSYFVMAADYCFAKGRREAALRNLAAAERASDKSPNLALFIAATYTTYGYPEKAIPLYLKFLPAMERYRYDSEMFKRNYSSVLNEAGMAYLKSGDAETARRYFEESLAVSPEQPGLIRY
jgi:tetratricopeptide (TPR) repeat protein